MFLKFRNTDIRMYYNHVLYNIHVRDSRWISTFRTETNLYYLVFEEFQSFRISRFNFIPNKDFFFFFPPEYAVLHNSNLVYQYFLSLFNYYFFFSSSHFTTSYFYIYVFRYLFKHTIVIIFIVHPAVYCLKKRWVLYTTLN